MPYEASTARSRSDSVTNGPADNTVMVGPRVSAKGRPRTGFGRPSTSFLCIGSEDVDGGPSPAMTGGQTKLRRFRDRFQKLLPAQQIAGRAWPRRQHIGRAVVDDAAIIHHIDAVGAADGGEPVGDQDRGAPGHQPLQRHLHLRLALGVERAGGLVEQQDRRVLQEGPGDRDALALAARQPQARLADRGVVALGQGHDELVAAAARAAASISAWLAPALA